jgi:hypothetical protein|tara:strand:- start:50 stop:481 length:432 start_codon:yes stop_codon:yes gene_type:complete
MALKSSLWLKQNNAPIELDITFSAAGAGTATLYQNKLCVNLTTGAAVAASSVTIDQKYFGGMRLVNAYIIASGTTASTCEVNKGTSAITDAIAHGTADKVHVRMGTLDDANWDFTDSDQVMFDVGTGVFAGLVVLEWSTTPPS